MKRLLLTITSAMLAISSHAQFVSSFSSSYVNEVKSKQAELSPNTKIILKQKGLWADKIDETLVTSYQHNCEKKLQEIVAKRKEFKLIAEIDKQEFSENTEAANTIIAENKIMHFSQREVDNIVNSTLDQKNILALALKNEENAYQEGVHYFSSLNNTGASGKIFFPFRDPDQAKKYFFGKDKQEYLKLVQDVMIQRNFDGSNSLNSELISAIAPIPSLPIKLAIGSTITQVDEKKIDSTNIGKNKLPYGGLFNATFTYPFVFTTINTGKKDHLLRIYVPMEYKFNIDEVKDNQPMANSYSFSELSGMLFMSIDLVRSDETLSKMNLFAGIKGSYYFGNEKFADRIGRRDFSLLQFNTGIKIADKFTIGFNIPLKSSYSNLLESQAASIALKFQPGI
ncbi:hypothetical protein HX021_19825 [Sphingobacterium sp. N143]|uniref:hypothetical protein n=1 Tax=Sphingobacterium sp. N143 TaxID=2746727 RepID=UPI00257878EB|nr:hypothetical protein [Sphingobacterium sp. N143]MDM1296541.1 hypothetical protein [Sphingobacterium sp. N143]